MERKFKPGDRVRCVNAGPNEVINGQVYTVLRVTSIDDKDDAIQVMCVGGSIYAHRFVLAEPAPAPLQFRTRTVTVREVSADDGVTWTAAPGDWQVGT